MAAREEEAAGAAGAGGADSSAEVLEEDALDIIPLDDEDAAAGEEDSEEDGDEEEDMRVEVHLEDTSRVQFTGHTDSVYCVAVSPVAPLALSGDGDDSWALWNMGSGEQIALKKSHEDTVICVGFNFDGSLFATAALDGVVKVRKGLSLSFCSLFPSQPDLYLHSFVYSGMGYFYSFFVAHIGWCL
jgi:WD40 repeat protein